MSNLIDLTNVFTDPIITASFASILAYLIATGARQWLDVPPIPVAVAVAVAVFLFGRYATPEQRKLLIDLFYVIFATLAAMGISMGVQKYKLYRDPEQAGPQGEAPLWVAADADSVAGAGGGSYDDMGNLKRVWWAQW